MSKSNLYFINLLIDQLWDEERVMEKIFPTRIPSSIRIVRSYENLALYLGASGDTVLGSAETDPSFEAYLGLHGISVATVKRVKSNPYDAQEWLRETQNMKPSDFDTVQVAGYSKLESQWLQKGSADLFRRLNSKAYLAQYAIASGMPFPATQVVRSQDLFQGLAPFDSAQILKANWSSGGGGSFHLKSNEEPLLKLISSRLQGEHPELEWLLQEKLDRANDYCCFGQTSNTAPSVWKIEYDQNGSSWRHTVATSPSSHQQEQSHWFTQISQKLSDEGYNGTFGIDGFVTQQGHFFPAVDLNVRINKCHLIQAVAKRFGIAPSEMDSQKLKFIARPWSTFAEWWSKARKDLGLNERGEKSDGSYFYPYLITTLIRETESDEQPRPMEICFFSGQKGMPSNLALSNWQRSIHDYFRGLSTESNSC